MNMLTPIPTLPVFENFSNDEIQELLNLDGALLTYQDEEFIIRQGESGSALFILIEGKVGIKKNQAMDIELNTLEPGTIFGESPLISSSPRLTNVIAKGETSVLKLDTRKFNDLNPSIISKLQTQLNKLLIGRLNNMNDHLAEVQTGINTFIKIYESHRKKMEEDPLISDEFKMIQKLWSAYFNDLRTK